MPSAPGSRIAVMIAALFFCFYMFSVSAEPSLEILGSGLARASALDLGTIHVFARNDSPTTCTIAEAFLSSNPVAVSSDPRLRRDLREALRATGVLTPAASAAKLSIWGRAIPWEVPPGELVELRLKPRELESNKPIETYVKTSSGELERIATSLAEFPLAVRAVRSSPAFGKFYAYVENVSDSAILIDRVEWSEASPNLSDSRQAVRLKPNQMHCFTLDCPRIVSGRKGTVLFWDQKRLLGGSAFTAVTSMPITGRSGHIPSSLDTGDDLSIIDDDAGARDADEPIRFALGCPSHEHGALEEASEKILACEQDNSGATMPVAIHLCRTSKERALPVFAPLADLVFFNPATATEFAGSDSSKLAAMDRLVAHAVGSAAPQPLWAVIGCETGARDDLFAGRYPTAEEMELLVTHSLSKGMAGLLYRAPHATKQIMPATLIEAVRTLNLKLRKICHLLQIACPENSAEQTQPMRFRLQIMMAGPDQRLIWVFNDPRIGWGEKEAGVMLRPSLKNVPVSYSLPPDWPEAQALRFDGNGFHSIDSTLDNQRVQWTIPSLASWELFLLKRSGEAPRAEQK